MKTVLINSGISLFMALLWAMIIGMYVKRIYKKNGGKMQGTLSDLILIASLYIGLAVFLPKLYEGLTQLSTTVAMIEDITVMQHIELIAIIALIPVAVYFVTLVITSFLYSVVQRKKSFTHELIKDNRIDTVVFSVLFIALLFITREISLELSYLLLPDVPFMIG